MTINTLDALISAMGNNSSRLVLDKASITSQAAGTYVSLWRATGQPGQGAIPGAAAVCNDTTAGSFNFAQQTSPSTTYATFMNSVSGNAAMTAEIHDRLMHMGGLSGIVTTAQTVNLDVHANIGVNNLSNRIGDASYSDIQWWMEWYTATGSTAATATIAVTYNDGTSGNLTGLSLAATRPASFMAPLNSLVPAAASGKFIRDIDSVTLSVSTGTAGSFGFTATRTRMIMPMNIANKTEVFDWATLGLPEIYNSSCLFPLVLTSTTSSGILRGGGKLSHG